VEIEVWALWDAAERIYEMLFRLERRPSWLRPRGLVGWHPFPVSWR